VNDLVVPVAAAVIARPDGKVLVAQRPNGKAFAGYWEFPGGKLEPGETPRHALVRELAEELGLTVRQAAPWLVQRFVYPHAHVELHFFRVLDWDGEPTGRDGQAFAWQTPGAFEVAPLLPANTLVLRALALPQVCGITVAAEIGETQFLARAQIALENGLKLIQFREKDWPEARQRGLCEAIVELARPFGARVLLNGSEKNARAWGCTGVHWTSAALAAANARPDDLLCSASCHMREEIAKAGALELDFALLGPVLPTPAHPAAIPLAWGGFASAVLGATLPVFALGGMRRSELDTAIAHGAHGIAMRRAAWG
jgi:8-oxo-dGTP diphosphatase